MRAVHLPDLVDLDTTSKELREVMLPSTCFGPNELYANPALDTAWKDALQCRENDGDFLLMNRLDGTIGTDEENEDAAEYFFYNGKESAATFPMNAQPFTPFGPRRCREQGKVELTSRQAPAPLRLIPTLLGQPAPALR